MMTLLCFLAGALIGAWINHAFWCARAYKEGCDVGYRIGFNQHRKLTETWQPPLTVDSPLKQQVLERRCTGNCRTTFSK